MKTFSKLSFLCLGIFSFCISPCISLARTNDHSAEYNMRGALSLTVTCPPDITLNCNDPVPSPDPLLVSATSPGCVITSITWTGDVTITGICPNEVIILRTYHVEDNCLNSADCIQTFTIIDNISPVIICPPNVVLNCSQSTSPPNLGSASAIDNCDPTVVIIHSDMVIQGICVNEYIVQRTFIATDDCGNQSSCIQIISVIDNTGPVISCQPNSTINCPSVPVFSTPSPIDACDASVSLTFADNITQGTCASSYSVTRTWTATDDCGNVSTCSSTIFVQDNTPPQITCPQNLTVSCSSQVPTPNPASITAIDNCGGTPTITHGGDVITNQICSDNYTLSRTYIATDACGNSSACVQIITVLDNVTPTITCPSNITVSCSGMIPPPGGANAIDNCGGAPLISSTDVITNQTCADQYTVSRTYHAIDACGNSSSCTQTITVFDNIAPILTCPANITTVCDSPIFAATAVDNCGGAVSISYSPSSGSVFPQGVTSVTATATDACGNTSTCSFTVTNYLGSLPNYHLMFSNASMDANWQGPTKGYIGDVAIDGLQAVEKTNGTIPYAGAIYTNATTLSNWQNIVNANSGQAASALNEIARLTALENQLENAFALINALPVTGGYDGVSPTSLNNLNTQNGTAQRIVINVTIGFTVSTKINITGDADDIFILRWDADKVFGNGYNGIVKFQNGGAIVPLGGLKASNFIHVAGDIKGGGAGSNPALPYPQGPRTNDGAGPLITGGSDFSGGGFFTGYWLTTGAPTTSGSGQPYGKTTNLTSAIFVGGWYSKTTKFSMGSGTSSVYVSPCSNQNIPLLISPSFDVATEENPSNALLVNVWPNPGENEFTLEIGSGSDKGNVVIVYDVRGTKVLQIDNPADQFIRFGEDLHDGIYIVHVLQGQKQGTIKIFKQGSR